MLPSAATWPLTRTWPGTERVTGVPASLWNNLESTYRGRLARLKERERLARDREWLKGIPVEERRFSRDYLYCADEAFLCGTAAEITPVRDVDDRRIGAGEMGPITREIQSTFFRAVRGQETKYTEWLTYVDAPPAQVSDGNGQRAVAR